MHGMKVMMVLVVLLVLLTITPQRALSTFPGENGLIAFSSTSSPDGGIVDIFTVNPDASDLRNLTNSASYDGYPKWSPDGRKIAFMSGTSGDIKQFEIYIMNADGSNKFRLTHNSVYDAYPSWSADGTKIAFSSALDGDEDIYVVNADGTNLIQLTNNMGRDWEPSWSPDGTKIAFSIAVSGSSDIYVMDVNGTNLTQLTNNAAWTFYPEWSPNGTQIVFYSNMSGNNEVYVMDADGSNQTNLTNNPAVDRDPTWSPDGTRIVFNSDRDGGIHGIYTMDADGTNQTLLFNGPGWDIGASWQPMPTTSGCFVDAPGLVFENEPFAATVTCQGVTDVYGFEYNLNIDPSSPILTSQEADFTPGSIFNGLSTLTLINSADAGHAVSLQAPETPVSGTFTLGSIAYDTDDPGTVLLTLDDFILGDINGHVIPNSLAANPNATITILDLLRASVEGQVCRQTGDNDVADGFDEISILVDTLPPDTHIESELCATFSYNEETVATNAMLEIDAPGHLSCLTPDLSLPDDTHTILDPIPLLAGDVNGDGEINLTDAAIIVSARVGDPVDPAHMPDLDEDGRIRILDLIHVARNFGATTQGCVP